MRRTATATDIAGAHVSAGAVMMSRTFIGTSACAGLQSVRHHEGRTVWMFAEAPPANGNSRAISLARCGILHTPLAPATLAGAVCAGARNECC
jgi:hypothetical protein